MARIGLLLVLLCACKGKEAPPAPASPPAPAPTPAPAEAAVAVPEAPKLVIGPDGIGPLQRLMWSEQSEQETAAIIQKALEPVLPGISTTVSEITAPGSGGEKKRYWSVKRGDKELVQVLADPHGNTPRPAVMIAYTPEIPAADGTKVGDTVAALLAKTPDIYCFNDPSEPIVGTVRADVTCHVKTEKHLLYVIDTTKRTLAQGTLEPKTLSDLAIVGIVGMPR